MKKTTSRLASKWQQALKKIFFSIKIKPSWLTQRENIVFSRKLIVNKIIEWFYVSFLHKKKSYLIRLDNQSVFDFNIESLEQEIDKFKQSNISSDTREKKKNEKSTIHWPSDSLKFRESKKRSEVFVRIFFFALLDQSNSSNVCAPIKKIHFDLFLFVFLSVDRQEEEFTHFNRPIES